MNKTTKEGFSSIAKQLELQSKINSKLIKSITHLEKKVEDVSRIAQDLINLSYSGINKARCAAKTRSREALRHSFGIGGEQDDQLQSGVQAQEETQSVGR